MFDIDKIIEDASDEHPYKQIGNVQSYSEYNEGWSDACDILGGRIKDALIKEQFTMKTFIVTYDTNYGLAVMVINNENLEMAKIIAKENGAWDGFFIEELDKDKKGVIFRYAP
jgi:hypothetical protein